MKEGTRGDFIYIIFITLFVFISFIVGYLLYDYYSFKTNVNVDFDENTKLLNKYVGDYENKKATANNILSIIDANNITIASIQTRDEELLRLIDESVQEKTKLMNQISKTLEEYQGFLENLKQQLASQTSNYNPFNKTAIKDYIDQVDEELLELLNTIDSKKENIAEIITRYHEAEVEQQQSLDVLSEKTIEINKVLILLINNNDEVHKIIAENWNTVTDVETPLADTTVSGMRNNISQKQENIASLQQSFSDNQSEINAMKAANQRTTENLVKIKAKVDALVDSTSITVSFQLKMNDLTTQSTYFEGRIAEITAEQSNIESQLITLKSEIERLEGEITRLETKKSEVDTELISIKSKIDDNNTILSSLNSKHETNNTIVSGIKANELRDDLLGIKSKRTRVANGLNETHITGFDSSLKYFFSFNENGDEINNTLHEHSFSGNKSLELKGNFKATRGMNIMTSENNNKQLQVCKRDSDNNCMKLAVNDGGMSFAPKNVSSFNIKGSNQNDLMKFDMDNRKMYIGGDETTAPMIIDDDKVLFKKVKLDTVGI